MSGPHRSYHPEMAAQLNRLWDRLDDCLIPLEQAGGSRGADARRLEYLIWHEAARLMRNLEELEILKSQEQEAA